MKKLLIIFLLFSGCSDEQDPFKDVKEDCITKKHHNNLKDDCICLFKLNGDVGLEGSYTLYEKTNLWNYYYYLDSLDCNLIPSKGIFEVISEDIKIGDALLKCDCK